MTFPFNQLARLIPLQRNRQSNTNLSLLNDVNSWWDNHRNLILEYWNLYSGYHNLFLQRFEAETDQDFIKRANNATVENHIAPIIDLIISHLYSKGVTRFVKRGNEIDETLKEFFEQSVWNHTSKIYHDIKALNTLVSGYTVIQRLLCDIRTNKPFSPGTDNLTKVKYGYIEKIPLDSSSCVPLPYVDENGITHYERFGALLFVADYDNYVGFDPLMRILQKDFTSFKVIEYITDDLWLKYRKGDRENEWNQITVGNGIFANKNPYRDISIPFTVYRNTGDPFYVEGDSEILKLKSLNLELNDLADGDKNVLRSHQYPILQGLNGATLPADFRRTKNAVLELEKKDAKFEYLTWDGNLSESRERQETIRRALSQVSGVSMIARNFLKEIGQIRSGPPLKALFTGDRAMMSRKFLYFSENEIKEMKADIRFFEKETGKDFNIDKSVKFEVKFDDDFLGIDALLEEEVKTLRLQTEGIKEVLESEHPDWTPEQIEETIKNINAQKMIKQQGQIQKSTDRSGLSQINK